MTTEELLKNTKCAVIVVDMQNDYCHPDGCCAKHGSDVSKLPEIIPYQEKLIETAHKNGMPVIFIQTIHTPETDSPAWLARSGGTAVGICRKNSWGAEFFGVSPSEKDIIVNKHRYSAFIHTRLETVLHTYKVETILVCGVSTNVCVESTARDGYMLDFNLILVDDCCFTSTPGAQEMTKLNITQRFGKVSTSAEIASILK